MSAPGLSGLWFLMCYMAVKQAAVIIRQGWRRTGKRVGETVKGRTWQCRRNACPSGDHSFSGWSEAPPTPQTYKEMTGYTHVRYFQYYTLTIGYHSCSDLLTSSAWPRSPAGPPSRLHIKYPWRPYCNVENVRKKVNVTRNATTREIRRLMMLKHSAKNSPSSHQSREKNMCRLFKSIKLNRRD